MKTGGKFKRSDILIVILMVLILVLIFYRIRSGLHYRWSWASIPQYLIRYDPQALKWVPNLLAEGLFNTIRLSFWATILASVIGGIMGLFRVSSGLLNRLIGSLYVHSIRNIPPLVLIFIFYYFLGSQILSLIRFDEMVLHTGEGARRILSILFAPPSLLPVFASGVIALAVFEGSYIAEIVRGGIQSIHFGQWEASSALGLNRRQQLRHVILPQAAHRILPPLAGQFISTLKDSAIVSVVSIQELTFQGLELMASTYLTFEIWITIAVMYLSLSLICSALVSRIENRMRRAVAG
ncbi:MAG: amino acid ABC transporter permease [Thermodesulfobacteriota bacterium]